MMKMKYRAVVALILFACLAIPAIAAGAADNGSTQITMSRNVFLAGFEIKAGTYKIQWEAKDAGAQVTFKKEGKIAVQTAAKIVPTEKKADYDSVLAATDPSGRQVLKGIEIGGKQFRIVFE